MKKIKVNSLPEGFEIRNGRIVEIKQQGGVTTGDQSNFGLVTTNTTQPSDDGKKSIKHSLTPVPRDEANIEAEGGETVLTDLNGDGQFGLYDIKGPRHNKGGVPLFLPEQSFVYSDFNKLKLDKDEMSEFNVESKKKLTPAKVSKKFDLNDYYGKIDDDYADNIQVRSAELMLDKNKMSLSKLALMQESKKEFKDGVPVSSHPYLMSIGEDPIEFTAKVEEISKQKAQQQIIESLPYEQQMQIAQLQEYMAQVNQQPQQQEGMQQSDMPQEMQQGMPPQGQGMMPPPPDMNPQQMAQLGYEVESDDLPMAQDGGGWWNKAGEFIEETVIPGIEDVQKEYKIQQEQERQKKIKASQDALIKRLDAEGILPDAVRNNPELLRNKKIFNALHQASKELKTYWLPGSTADFKAKTKADITKQINELQTTQADPVKPKSTRTTQSTQSTSSGPGKGNISLSDDLAAFLDEIGMEVTSAGDIAETSFRDRQRQKDLGYGDFGANYEGMGQRFSEIYPEWDEFEAAIDRTKGQGKIKEAGDYQHWYNSHLDEVATLYMDRLRKQNPNMPDDEYIKKHKETYQELLENFGFVEGDDKKGFKLDSLPGTVLSSRPVFNLKDLPYDIKPAVEVELDEEDDTKKKDPLTVPDVAAPHKLPEAEFWLQDLIKLNAIKQRKRDMFFPWQPAVRRPEVDYTLEDPTRAIAAMNEQLNIANQAAGIFSGPQSLAARTAESQSKAATNIANVIAGVNQRNVSTVNKGLALQTRYDQMANIREDAKNVAVYDDTQEVLQKYMDEKNFDREQYAEQLSNAYTNRANTYNMNSLQDYYQIDPSTGGMIGQFSSKAWQPIQPTEYDYNNSSIAEFIDSYYRKYNTTPPDNLMKYVLQQSGDTSTSPETYGQRNYRLNKPMQGFDYRSNYKYKEGGEIKSNVIPFFTGVTGI